MTSAAEGEGGFKMLTVADKGGGVYIWRFLSVVGHIYNERYER